MQGRRASFVGDFTETQFDIIDAVQQVATDLGTTAPAVALAWVQSQPGVASTIIGARTLEHLEDNLKALDLHLAPEQLSNLNQVSKPTLNFPADFNRDLSPNFAHAGATVNGVPSTQVANVPTDDSQRW